MSELRILMTSLIYQRASHVILLGKTLLITFLGETLLCLLRTLEHRKVYIDLVS